jgi:5-methylcytosine-specific restriction enzyme subunit McrC
VNLDAGQTVYPCAEFAEVAIPFGDLFADGSLDIYPEIAAKGYFDIDYRRGALVLRATRFVGLIPISQRVAIHVRPRAPIGNLMWLAWRCGVKLPALEGVLRNYAIRSGEVDSPEALYVDAFLSALERIASGDILKRYCTGATENSFRGRLSISRSIGRFYARGIHYRHVFEPTDLTADNAENRVIKHTAKRLLRFLQKFGDTGRRTRFAKALGVLDSVDDTHVTPDAVASQAMALIRALPSTHSHYSTALWLSYLIATNAGVALEEFGPARLESVVINVSDLFETYVRHVCAEAEGETLDCHVRSGNRQPLRLFEVGTDFPIKPDMYFLRNGQIPAVADAKYKPKPSEEDRYALLAYCDATGASRGALILPADRPEQLSETLGVTSGGKQIEIIRVNLAAADMRAEEARFLDAIRTLVVGPLAAQEVA